VNTFIDQRAVERIRAEYLEMPGMKLTPSQVQRLCGVDSAACQSVLEALVQTNFLSLRPDGTYIRSTEGRLPNPQPAKTTLTRFVPGTRRAS